MKKTAAETLNWGIIGAGDVTEKKSGPALSKVPGSRLLAIMRRTEAKARDYAQRHGVPRWYTDADALLDDPDMDAIYIATPPDKHYSLTLKALGKGKAVYLEKPMTLDGPQAEALEARVTQSQGKLVVAHYRRAQPYFNRVKTLLEEGAIGRVRYIDLRTWHCGPTPEEMRDPRIQWRLDPAQSGGGLFHDLAPHQLDLMCYFFGPVQAAWGQCANQRKFSVAEDMVIGQIRFENQILFTGSWMFQAPRAEDICEILGEKGSICFSVFEHRPIRLLNSQGEQTYSFDPLEHVQQPMIAATTRYFQGKGPNPCDVGQGRQVMHLMDVFTKQS